MPDYFLAKYLLFFQSLDSKFIVYCCDFFNMTPKVFQHEKCNAVFDRGAFEAILECDRSDYVKIILPLLANDFKYILSICDYEDETFVGSVGCRQEVKKLFTGHEIGESVRTVVELLEEEIFQTSGLKYSDQNTKAINSSGKMMKLVYCIKCVKRALQNEDSPNRKRKKEMK